MVLKNIEVGMHNVIQRQITEKDTAVDFGTSVIKDLLSTPALATLMIEASIELVDPSLPDGHITIGKTLNINHQQPTTKGMTVSVNTTISEIKDHKVVFTITAYDEIGEIGTGYHERYIVNNNILGENVTKRIKTLRTQP